MAYEVCPGQCVQYNGTKYPAGAIVPDLPNHDELKALGIVRAVEAPAPRPKPSATKKAAKKKTAAKKAE